MWQALRAIVIPAVMAFAPLVVLADSPAQLVVGEGSIEARLNLPASLKPGRYAVHCEAYIVRNGDPQQVYCYTLEAPVPAVLVAAVTKAASRAKFIPAVRARKRIDVYVVFMVLVDTTLAEPLVVAVPNNGVERKRLGLLYTAPQRVMNTGWRPYAQNYSDRRPPLFVLLKLQIDELGKVIDVKINNLTGVREKTVERYEEQARSYDFLPGYDEGKAKAMWYAEPIFDVY